jgi:hypothetical protein
MINKLKLHGGAALLLIAGCATHENEPRTLQDAHVADAVSALQGAVAACAEQRASCPSTDAASAMTCDEGFASCREAAQADNGPKLDRAVNECAEASRSCREAARDDEATAACADQLKSCVGENKPLPPERPDAAADRDSPSPVADCISTLRSCIEGGAPAHDCTSALRACVMAAVGHGGGHGGKPGAPGNSGEAGNTERPDAGRMDGDRPDAGRADEEHPPADAGTAFAPDAGMSAQAMACKAAYEECLAGGESRETCAPAQRYKANPVNHVVKRSRTNSIPTFGLHRPRTHGYKLGFSAYACPNGISR